MTLPGTVRATQEILEQGLTLLGSVDAQIYATKAGEPFSASIGGHYRHVLDHFLCLAAGAVSGTIDYDHRSRDRELEQDRARAEQMTQVLIQTFRTLSDGQLAKNCEVVYSVGYSSGAPERIQTTLARELAYCVSHAVHHFAIIKLLCAHLSVPTQVEFGVAPSTLEYRRMQAAG